MGKLFSEFDDLEVVSGSFDGSSEIVLSAIVRNEMYLLPVFFEHYRTLGVDQFVILDDRSNDGTTEFLAKQHDVVVVRSGWKYGDRVEPTLLAGVSLSSPRILYIWRALLLQKFPGALGTVHVDADEFISLPKEIRFQNLALKLEQENARAAWGVMLDLYPKDLSSMSAMKNSEQIDRNDEWYFDGVPHLKLRSNKAPKVKYPGGRARLYHTYGAVPTRSRMKMLLRSRLGFRVPRSTAIRKPVLLRWRDGAHFTSSHAVTLKGSTRMLLPIEHYRFTGSIYSRIETALAEKSYSGGSGDYRRLVSLFEQMKSVDGSFADENSRRADISAFIETRNAIFPT